MQISQDFFSPVLRKQIMTNRDNNNKMLLFIQVKKTLQADRKKKITRNLSQNFLVRITPPNTKVLIKKFTLSAKSTDNN